MDHHTDTSAPTTSPAKPLPTSNTANDDNDNNENNTFAMFIMALGVASAGGFAMYTRQTDSLLRRMNAVSKIQKGMGAVKTKQKNSSVFETNRKKN